MTDDIELPKLVGTLAALPERTRGTIELYGRACAHIAILADRERRAQPAPVAEAVAWAIFSENGNIRIWSAERSDLGAIAEQHGPLTPLYDRPPSDHFVGTDIEALQRDATRYRWLKGLNDGVIMLQNDEGVLIEDAADTAIDEDMAKQKGGQL